MNALDLMKMRLNYEGSTSIRQDKMIRDKQKSLQAAFASSYQSAKVREVGSETIERALINPNTVKQDYDDKTISIDYKCDYKPGTVFEWVNTNTKWLVYLQDLTELAYFRGDIRKCNYEIKWKDDEGKELSTFAAVRGPIETKLNSINTNGASMDLPNHTLYLMLPATKEVLEHFVRYTKFYLTPLKEGDKPVCWRVEATDTISTSGILEVTAEEYYIDSQKDDAENGLADIWVEPIPELQDSVIVGDIFIKPKKSYVYKYTGSENGIWNYDTRLPIEATINDKEITIIWKTTYTGEFELRYAGSTKTIVVESLF